MLHDYEVTQKFSDDCRSIMAGLTITEAYKRFSSAPFEVGQVVEGFNGAVFEILEITKL